MTNYFEGALLRSGTDRPSLVHKHMRAGYEAAGLDAPATITEDASALLLARSSDREGRANAIMAQAVREANPEAQAALVAEAADLFADSGGYRADGAQRAQWALEAAQRAALTEVREQAARDFQPALKDIVKRLGKAGNKFDPAATSTLDPAHLGLQRQHEALALLPDVEDCLTSLGRMTLTPGIGRALPAGLIRPTELVVAVEYDDAADPAPTPWVSRGGFDADVFLLAAASGWITDGTVTWRLLVA